MGANAAMGGLGTHPPALLDGTLPDPDRHGPYDHPAHHQPVLTSTGRSRTASTADGPSRVGHISATFWQRQQCASLYFHVLFLEGVSVERADKRLTPRFVTVEPPTDADSAALIHTISQRVIRQLRQLGYLEAGMDATVATGR